MTISTVIMAHRARTRLVARLLARLDRLARVQWDPNERPSRANEWPNGAAAWQVIDRSTGWGLVLQDDAVVCRDLVGGLERALQHVPAEAVVCLFLGNQRYLRTTGISQTRDEPWVVMSAVTSGVGILVPTWTIDGMLTWCEQDRNPYDARIGRYYETVLGWPTYYPLPSLVDHAVVPSLVGHPEGRRAYRFIGEQSSALDVDWSRGVFHAGRIVQKGRQRV